MTRLFINGWHPRCTARDNAIGAVMVVGFVLLVGAVL